MLASKEMTINIENKLLIIKVCESLAILIKIALNLKTQFQQVVKATANTTILPNSMANIIVFIKRNFLTDNRIYVFEPKK